MPAPLEVPATFRWVMARVRLTCFDPVKGKDTFGYLYAEILDGKKLVTAREYNPNDFASFRQMEKHLCQWLRNNAVDRGEIRFLAAKQSRKTGVQDVNQLGTTASFQLGEADIDFTDFLIDLPEPAHNEQ
jgi:hypothetical protein